MYETICCASHAARFGRAWGHPIPSQEGMVVTEFMEEAYKGNIKALYVTGENPLLSEPDLHHAEESLRNLEFLVVQDLFLHERRQQNHYSFQVSFLIP